MGRRGRRAATPRAGGKPAKVDGSALVHFDYGGGAEAAEARSRGGVGGGWRGRRVRRTRAFSREEYVRASYRFVADVDEGARQAMVCVDDDDVAVPWELVEAVMMFETDEPPLACPICLYPPTAPQVTACGHVYCYTCILRFAAAFAHDPTALCPCPMCEAHVDTADLRAVVFSHVAPIAVGSHLTMAKLVRPADSSLALPLSDAFPAPPPAIPTASELDALNIPFARLAAADPPAVLALLADHTAALTAARADFVACHEPENIPAADDALARLAARTAAWRERADTAPPPVPSATLAAALPPATGRLYTLYQADDGQLVFLDTFNVKMLFAEYGAYDAFPPTVSGTVVASTELRQSPETRKRFKHLAHLPLTANFRFVELVFDDGVVSPRTKAAFAAQAKARKKKRDARERRSDIDSARASSAREAIWRTHVITPMPVPEYSPTDFPSFDPDAPLAPPSAPAPSPSPAPAPGSARVAPTHSFTDAIRGGVVSNTTLFPTLSDAGLAAAPTPPLRPPLRASAGVWASTSSPHDHDADDDHIPWGVVSPPPPPSGPGSGWNLDTLRAVSAPDDAATVATGGKKGKRAKGRKKQLLFTNSTARRA